MTEKELWIRNIKDGIRRARERETEEEREQRRESKSKKMKEWWARANQTIVQEDKQINVMMGDGGKED